MFWLRLLLKIILFLLLLISFGFAVFSWLYSHTEFLQFLIQQFHLRAEKDVLHNMLPREKYELIRLILVLATVFLFVLFLVTDRLSRALYPLFKELRISLNYRIETVRHSWHSLPQYARITAFLVFLILILYRVWSGLRIPFLTDEVYSYIFLVDRGLPVIVSSYHGPNSHILYLAVAWVFDSFLPAEMAMRLPVMLTGILVPVLLFFTLLKRYNFLIAFFTAVVFAFSFNITYYSVIGRGHIFFILFFLIALIAAVRITEGGGRAAFFVYGLANVCGAYTLLSWIFPGASLFVFLLYYLRKDLKRLIRLILTVVISFLMILLLYLPVLLISGIESMTENWWVQSVTYSYRDFFIRLPAYMRTVGEYFWSTPDNTGLLLSLLYFSIGAALLYFRKNSKFLFLYLSLILLPFIMISIRGILPPEKTWLYFFLLKAFSLALILDAVAIRMKMAALRNLFLIASLLLILIWNGRIMHRHSFDFYHRMQSFLSGLPPSTPDSVLVREETYYLYLRYRFEVERDVYPLLHMNPKEDVEYDMIVVPVSFPSPEEGYEKIYQNKEIKAFRKVKE